MTQACVITHLATSKNFEAVSQVLHDEGELRSLSGWRRVPLLGRPSRVSHDQSYLSPQQLEHFKQPSLGTRLCNHGMFDAAARDSTGQAAL